MAVIMLRQKNMVLWSLGGGTSVGMSHCFHTSYVYNTKAMFIIMALQAYNK